MQHVLANLDADALERGHEVLLRTDGEMQTETILFLKDTSHAGYSR